MSEEHAYAYEAGYRDGSIHYELEHCPSCQNIADLQEALEENAKLRELCTDLYVLCYEHEVGWKLVDSTWEKYEPCDLCKERHGGKSPCASTSRDMSEECCDPYQAELFAKCMAALGIEVPDGEF